MSRSPEYSPVYRGVEISNNDFYGRKNISSFQCEFLHCNALVNEYITLKILIEKQIDFLENLQHS